jgi:integrase/recombinase XerC
MNTYHDEVSVKSYDKLKEMLQTLPPYCANYFNARNDVLEPRTAVSYAGDLNVFFHYIKEANPLYRNVDVSDIPVEAIGNMESTDIEEFLAYLSHYTMNGSENKNGDKAKAHKLATLKAFFKYLVKSHYIDKNPAELVETPKVHKKDIIALNTEDTERLFTEIQSGNGLTKKQLERHEQNKARDNAILMVLLGTGIRVSELVGLNLSDVDLTANRLSVIRKGGNQDHVYFSEPVANALREYIGDGESNIIGTRHSYHPADDEKALFISYKKNRLAVRSVQYLVSTYADIVFGAGNHISPHKMRSSYGTALYEQTGDLELVSKTLGHASVMTASTHYIKYPEEKRREAANYNKLIK